MRLEKIDTVRVWGLQDAYKSYRRLHKIGEYAEHTINENSLNESNTHLCSVDEMTQGEGTQSSNSTCWCARYPEDDQSAYIEDEDI